VNLGSGVSVRGTTSTTTTPEGVNSSSAGAQVVKKF
jgi:hypothetical protein